MTTVRGKYSLDVAFTDATTASNVNSLKSITLQQASEYASGKVVLVSGTVGTAAVTVAMAPSVYKDASGTVVSLSAPSWYAFQASALARCDEIGGDGVAASADGFVSSSVATGSTAGFSVYSDAGTASYTLVVYGD
jgi:hypothetical protein